MKKRILTFSLIIIMFASIVPVAFGASRHGSLYYTESYGTVTITGCENTVTTIAIPEKIGGNPVIEIADGAFKDKTQLTAIHLPKTVMLIGESAFSGCTNLAALTLSESLLAIGPNAFEHCTKLKSLSLPKDVITIGSKAFYGCKKLESVTLSENLVYIDDWAFTECKSLKSITMSKNLVEIGNWAFSQCSALETLEFGSGVYAIGNWAFEGCTSLKSVTVPPSMESIGSNAFEDCTAIKEVYISDVATWCNIDFATFDSNPLSHGANLYVNKKLVGSIDILNTVDKIGNYAFAGCKSLTSVDIENDISSIGTSAFEGCFGIKKIAIPKKVSEIKQAAFASTGIKIIFIPKKVELIEQGVFYNTNIDCVYYGGSEQDRQNITIRDYNESLENAQWVYNATSLPKCTFDSDYDDSCNVCGEKRIASKDTSLIFTDVKSNSWYKKYVDYAVPNGIFSGTSKTTFSPNNNITRAEFVQVLANLNGVDTSNRNVTTQFTDVPAKKWFTPAVKWASESKIVNGVGGGRFDPNANVTREQMCLMLTNFAKFNAITLKTIEAKENFADDSKISKWAKTAVYACQQADIVNGKGAGKFDPQGTGTRAEASVIFSKFHKDYLVK